VIAFTGGGGAYRTGHRSEGVEPIPGVFDVISSLIQFPSFLPDNPIIREIRGAIDADNSRV